MPATASPHWIWRPRVCRFAPPARSRPGPTSSSTCPCPAAARPTVTARGNPRSASPTTYSTRSRASASVGWGHEIYRRRGSRTRQPNRLGHLAIRVTRVGLRRQLCRRRRARHRAARPGLGGDAFRHRRDLRVRQERADPRRGTRRRARRGRGGQQGLPGGSLPRRDQAPRARECAAARPRRIPLYQIHQPNPVVPDSVIMPGMRDLLDGGKIGAAGVSNYSLARWQRADAALGRPVISNQVHFSLASPGALEDLVPFAERENRIVIAWSPLEQGLLGGKYGLNNRPGGIRATNRFFGTENLRRVEPLLQTLRDIAREVDAKPAQVALAWLISLPGVVAIPGASSVEQLEFNVAAADIELSSQSRDALAAARAFKPTSNAHFLAEKVRERLGH